MVVLQQSSSANMAKLLFLIIILTAVGQMTQTMYVPSIAAMATDFAVQPTYLQAVMAAYLIPYGLSQFVYGPLSDRIGRRPVIMAGMTIFMMGTLAALFAPSFEYFLLASFIQGSGTGCAGAMSRTVTRDCYDGASLHRANSLVSMGVIFSPLLAPVVGGYLSMAFDWKASYLFLLIFGALVTLAMFTMFDETLPKEKRRNERVWTSYSYVLSNRQFQGYVFCLIATFAGIAVFEAAAGVLLGSVLKLDPTTVSWLFVLPLPGYLLGAWLSATLSVRIGQRNLFNIGMVTLIVGALAIFIPGMAGLVTVVSLIGGGFISFIGAGIIFPAATTAAIQPFPHHAGTAGAILGGMQNLGAGLATLAASLMGAKDQFNLGSVMLVAAVLVVISILWVRRRFSNDAAMTPSL
ncbi:multidrug efflux MFS transporter EmrD [Moritella sp. F3]|uniref:multidrug efflux MFS transporter EmrD n=1 Tax=Moritella sp. F3 TaxID=2718882 RepID=UPI0018E14B55|nr:multidrug efflux MFS transporter EmrD [Moritella sp. F3]GIC75709.1 Bcr/CflA family drug resistance efflux transporter [Moritella sp. F1]GIC81843.1 Bcr/CflA family drug resistance efflux transporter [Moritella sp. F3]